jgi:DNA-binding transcriptional MerR regulator
MATEYFTQKILKTEQFYVEPEIDYGFNWDSNRYEVIQETNYLEGGMVSIENMRKALDEFEKQGANYVNVDFHCDHNEVEVTGVIFGRSTQEEIDAHIKQELDQKEAKKQKEIARLQAEIERIKSL